MKQLRNDWEMQIVKLEKGENSSINLNLYTSQPLTEAVILQNEKFTLTINGSAIQLFNNINNSYNDLQTSEVNTLLVNEVSNNKFHYFVSFISGTFKNNEFVENTYVKVYYKYTKLKEFKEF